jgi:hypothetical protein
VEVSQRLRGIAAYVIFALVFGIGVDLMLSRQTRNRAEARRQTCTALAQANRTLADVISLAVPPVRPVDLSLSPELQRLIAESQKRTQAFLDRAQVRLSRPIPFCVKAGVDTTVTVRGATPLPVQVTGVPGTTTTTTTSRGGSAARSTTRTTRRAGSRSTPTTRPGGSSSTPPPGPSSPTTTRCRVRVPTDGCLP